ncbi:MAG: M28 family metallopeptidase [Planctomycetota bacterium]|jgi:hypothetical protein
MRQLLRHSGHRHGLAILLAVITFLVLSTAQTALAQGTPMGRYAARLVDDRIYRYFMEEKLYAHDGDDRGFGPEHDLCRDNIEQLFIDYGLVVSLHDFNWSGSTYFNVVGEIPGTIRADQIYVVAGHFDSVNNPGADDNASAVAALLEIARIAGQWKSEATIRLISFDREEQYLIGSQAYVNDFVYEDFRGVISLDMIAYSGPDPDKARIHGRTQSDPLKNAVAQALRDYGELEPLVLGELDRTDHAPFEWAGFQGCWLAEFNYIEYNPHYHKQTDSLDTPNYIDFEYGAKMTRAVIGWLVDEAGLRPPEFTLFTDTCIIPESGGTANFTLDAGSHNAGRDYILVGSVTGTEPGTPLPGGHVTLPLNWDWFTDFVIALINTPVFLNFLGTLDTSGTATAQLNAPPAPGFAGITMHYAYALNNPWDFVSNPVAIEVVD